MTEKERFYLQLGMPKNVTIPSSRYDQLAIRMSHGFQKLHTVPL